MDKIQIPSESFRDLTGNDSRYYGLSQLLNYGPFRKYTSKDVWECLFSHQVFSWVNYTFNDLRVKITSQTLSRFLLHVKGTCYLTPPVFGTLAITDINDVNERVRYTTLNCSHF